MTDIAPSSESMESLSLPPTLATGVGVGASPFLLGWYLALQTCQQMTALHVWSSTVTKSKWEIKGSRTVA